MTRRVRRFIFYIFLGLFIILAFVVVLYAQGYSFDWQKKSLVATGAFYFKSYPEKAKIYLDNEYKGKTNKFIKRLIPKKYDIKISKPGYHDWKKTLEIESRLVTTSKNILLIKKDSFANLVTDHYNVKHFSVSNDQKKIVYLTDKIAKEIDPTQQKIADPREIPTYSQFALRLIDLSKDIDTQIYPSPFFRKNGNKLPNLKNLLKISWSSNDQKLLLSFPYNDYVFDLENASKIINLNNLIKIASNYQIYNIKNSLFHFQDSNKVYFLFNNNLFLIDLINTNPPLHLASNILSYNVAENKILYIQIPNYYLYEMNLDGSNKQKIAELPKGIQETQLSSDNRKLFWRTKNEIGVIWLEAESEQPLREKYEHKIIMKTFKDIDQAAWHTKTNQHIIFSLEDKIKITELDGRDQRNTADIITIEQPVKLFYNKWNEKLYVLSNEQLFEINIK